MRILLAEDVGVTRRMLEEVLRDMGHDVEAVSDGAHARAALEREPFPLLVLDWMMPAPDGLALCREIRARAEGADVFILLQTGRGTSEDLGEALAAGVDDYITKPVTAEHLRARVAIAELRMRQRAEQRATDAELARARWLAGVGETSLALQHEIATPLSALLGEISLGLDAGGPAAMRAALEAARVQATRVAHVLNVLASLEAPHSVEPLPGLRMLDLHDKERDT